MSIREAENMPHVETEKEFYVKKLEEVADVFHADVTFYEGLYEYISKRNFPGPEILDVKKAKRWTHASSSNCVSS